MKKSVWFIIILCGYLLPLRAQVVRSKEFVVPVGMSEAEVDKVIGNLGAKLNEYQRVGKLMNPKTKTMDRDAIAAFKVLFETDAKLYNDLAEAPDNVLYDVDSYVSIARRYFSEEGIIFGISDEQLRYVALYPEEYVCSVFLLKSIDKFYTADGDLRQESRTLNLEFVFSVPKNNPSNCRIRTIRSGEIIAPPADYHQFMGLDLRAYTVQLSNSDFPLREKYGAQGTAAASASLAYQGGVVWYSNFFAGEKKRKKNLFATVGLNFYYGQIEGKLEKYALPAEPAFVIKLSNGAVYDSLLFQAQEVTVHEKMTLGRVQLPVGLSFRLINREKSALMLDLTYVPSYSLMDRSEVGDNSLGVYNLYGVKGNFNYDYLKAEPGTNSLSSSYDLLVKGRSLGAQPIAYNLKPGAALRHQAGASLTFFKDFGEDSRRWGMAIGVDALMGFGAAVENYNLENGPLYSGIKDGKDVQYPDRGVLGTYVQDIKLLNAGLRLVIYRKAARNP